MSTAARIGLGLAKWVIVPLALGLAGYFLIGPRIGQAPPGVVANAQPAAPKVLEDEGPPKRSFVEPEVEVSVSRTIRRPRPMDATTESERPRRQRNRVERVPEDPDASVSSNDSEPPADGNTPVEPPGNNPDEPPPLPPDEGGSGGVQGTEGSEPPSTGTAG